MRSQNHLCAALALLALAGCGSLSPDTPRVDPTVRITILHTNDHHGRFWRNRDGEYGMAARKTVVDTIRREVAEAGGYSLLLDGGDVNTGVPESDLQDAVPDFQGMNLLGYDAMAVGNHEFDKSPYVLRMQRDLARFPMLSANVYRQGQRMFDPYKIFQLGGVRVAVMGLTTEDTQKMVHPDNIREVEFRNPIREASQLVPQLRNRADIVIAATHMGHYEDGRHGTQAPGDVEMARAVQGINLIVGGHSQNPVCMQTETTRNHTYVPGGDCRPDRQNGTWIVQAHEWGKYVGRADFEYRQGVFQLVQYRLIPVNLKRMAGTIGEQGALVTYTPEITEDRDMLALLQPYQEFGQKKLLVEVGRTDARLEGDRAVVRRQPTNLGLLVGLAMMEKTHADFAVVNAGGVRDSLPAGSLTYKDLLKVHPFGNTLVTVDLTGAEVLDYLATATSMTPGSGAFAQFAGVRMRIRNNTMSGVEIGGKPLVHTARYRMVVNNFVSAGGDGYPKLTQHPSFVDTGFVDADALREFIATRSPLRASDYAPDNTLVRH